MSLLCSGSLNRSGSQVASELNAVDSCCLAGIQGSESREVVGCADDLKMVAKVGGCVVHSEVHFLSVSPLWPAVAVDSIDGGEVEGGAVDPSILGNLCGLFLVVHHEEGVSPVDPSGRCCGR